MQSMYLKVQIYDSILRFDDKNEKWNVFHKRNESLGRNHRPSSIKRQLSLSIQFKKIFMNVSMIFIYSHSVLNSTRDYICKNVNRNRFQFSLRSNFGHLVLFFKKKNTCFYANIILKISTIYVPHYFLA